MRRLLASSIGVTCAAALSLPLVLTASAAPRAPVAEGPVPGTTQSIPLAPLAPPGSDRAAGPADADQGLRRRAVRPFSMVGVVWDDPDAELHGDVQVRTRDAGTPRWSGWQAVETHHREHAADPDSAERASGRVRGSTAPLWVGRSDGVEVRVRAEDRRHPGATGDRALRGGQVQAGDGAAPGGSGEALPAGLRLELVAPGAEPPPGGALSEDTSRLGALGPEAAASGVNTELVPLGATEIPPLSREETREQLVGARPGAKPYIGPRPRIITRRGWGADEQLRESGFRYTKRVRAAFVHHTASGNKYRCSQVPSLIRSIYRYHVVSSGWRDIGYNFLVDKCGNIYEGRAGGVARAVMGAHTLGFNVNSMGIAVLGSYDSSKPPARAVRAIARLTAWKLGLYGANPRGKTYLTSGGGNLYRKGKKVRLNVISGHRDGFATECPGRRLYGKLGTTRSTAAHLQGR
ncbi:peptidoglycan recognition protein [Streptomyces sp. CRN 30]|uniref:peptidoglycan recognition protein family protein n=1 Tax=Streptomyces sp. CRN 30 TaxID=3075613 RepID=UPI002A81B285|nr:peptidoglycan recognition protein [Streptomyces sp. CRN 30]